MDIGKRFLAGFIACVAFGVSHHAIAAPTQAKIVLSHSGMNARQTALWIAHEQGFFTKYGLNTDLVFIRTAPIQVAAINAGQIHIGYTAAATVLGASASGAELKILAAFTNRLTYDLVARREIKRPEDLRGKRFGVQSIGGAVWMGAVLGLEHLKMDPRRDQINILVVGDQTVLSQALEVAPLMLQSWTAFLVVGSNKKGFRFWRSSMTPIFPMLATWSR